MKTVLLGKPGSGKGTQAKLLAQRLKIPAISTGDLFRAAAAAGSTLGHEFRSYMDKGLLVPDRLVLAVVEDRLSESDCNKGFVLDGFPRTVAQAEELDGWLRGLGTAVDAVVAIEVSDQALVRRAEGRVSCPHDGHIYHRTFAPPKIVDVCDACGGPLVRRQDDDPEVVLARIAEYRAKSAPVVAYYEGRGVLQRVDGEQPLHDVTAALEQCIVEQEG